MPIRKFPMLTGATLNESQSTRSSLGPAIGLGKSKMSLFSVVAATRAWKRLALQRKPIVVKPKIRYENTYRLSPDITKQFNSTRVEKMVRDILENRLRRFKYSPEYCKSMATDLVAIIKAKVKAMDFERYKIVCNVMLAEKQDQGVHISSRCIWNLDTDNYATVSYSNQTVTAVVLVHGLYFE